ncbi:trypsin [Ostertagia ostertagi]
MNGAKKSVGQELLVEKSMALSFGGRPAKEGEYPWAVFIERDIVCSGALISQRHVLTAAHCFTSNFSGPKEKCNGYKITTLPTPKESFKFWFGTECAKHTHSCPKPKTRSSATIYLRQDGCRDLHDVAIAELDKPVPESLATPICTPDKSTKIPKKLKFIGNGVISPDGQTFGGHQVVDLDLDLLNKEKLIVQTKAKNGTGLCPGDSGGILFTTDKKGRSTAVGTYTGGETCYINYPKDYPGKKEHIQHGTLVVDYFSDLTFYADWICGASGACNSPNTKGSQRNRKKKKRTISM